MILQSLVAYYEAKRARGEIDVPGWAQVKIGWALDLDDDGQIVQQLYAEIDENQKDAPLPGLQFWLLQFTPEHLSTKRLAEVVFHRVDELQKTICLPE